VLSEQLAKAIQYAKNGVIPVSNWMRSDGSRGSPLTTRDSNTLKYVIAALFGSYARLATPTSNG